MRTYRKGPDMSELRPARSGRRSGRRPGRRSGRVGAGAAAALGARVGVGVLGSVLGLLEHRRGLGVRVSAADCLLLRQQFRALVDVALLWIGRGHALAMPSPEVIMSTRLLACTRYPCSGRRFGLPGHG